MTRWGRGVKLPATPICLLSVLTKYDTLLLRVLCSAHLSAKSELFECGCADIVTVIKQDPNAVMRACLCCRN